MKIFDLIIIFFTDHRLHGMEFMVSNVLIESLRNDNGNREDNVTNQ